MAIVQNSESSLKQSASLHENAAIFYSEKDSLRELFNTDFGHDVLAFEISLDYFSFYWR